jgi:hypothetical protein
VWRGARAPTSPCHPSPVGVLAPLHTLHAVHSHPHEMLSNAGCRFRQLSRLTHSITHSLAHSLTREAIECRFQISTTSLLTHSFTYLHEIASTTYPVFYSYAWRSSGCRLRRRPLDSPFPIPTYEPMSYVKSRKHIDTKNNIPPS